MVGKPIENQPNILFIFRLSFPLVHQIWFSRGSHGTCTFIFMGKPINRNCCYFRSIQFPVFALLCTISIGFPRRFTETKNIWKFKALEDVYATHHLTPWIFRLCKPSEKTNWNEPTILFCFGSIHWSLKQNARCLLALSSRDWLSGWLVALSENQTKTKRKSNQIFFFVSFPTYFFID